MLMWIQMIGDESTLVRRGVVDSRLSTEFDHKTM